MEEKELTTTEEVIEGNEGETTESSGMRTGLAMLIGGGLALAGLAIGKKVKKVIETKKELEVANIVDEEDDFEDDSFDNENSND